MFAEGRLDGSLQEGGTAAEARGCHVAGLVASKRGWGSPAAAAVCRRTRIAFPE